MTDAQLIVLIVGSVITAIPALLFLFRLPVSPLHGLAVLISHNAPGPNTIRFRLFAYLANGGAWTGWKKYGRVGVIALILAAIFIGLFFLMALVK